MKVYANSFNDTKTIKDEMAMGKTVNMLLLKECSMTSYFLNAVSCLYGNRYEEAMGYADLVLSRRACPEAMFIKGRAMYVMGKYKEAEEMVSMMTSATLKSEEERVIDKKLLLFKEKVNDKVGN